MKVSKRITNTTFEQINIELKIESLDDLESAHTFFGSVEPQTFEYADLIFNLLEEELNKYK